jgi:hypothetical protein
MRRRLAVSVAGLLAVGALVAPGALAAKPTFERIAVDETFPDEFLTEECGFPVETTAFGHITMRTFDTGDKGVTEVVSVNVGLTATANGREFRFRDVGSDVERITPEGEVILSVTGQLPFQYTGTLKVNVTTGETLVEPRHVTDTDEACAVLAG